MDDEPVEINLYPPHLHGGEVYKVAIHPCKCACWQVAMATRAVQFNNGFGLQVTWISEVYEHAIGQASRRVR